MQSWSRSKPNFQRWNTYGGLDAFFKTINIAVENRTRKSKNFHSFRFFNLVIKKKKSEVKPFCISNIQLHFWLLDKELGRQWSEQLGSSSQLSCHEESTQAGREVPTRSLGRARVEVRKAPKSSSQPSDLARNWSLEPWRDLPQVHISWFCSDVFQVARKKKKQ